MSNAFDDIQPDPQAQALVGPQANAFDDIAPPPKKNPNRPDGSKQPTSDDIEAWVSHAIPHTLGLAGRAVSDAAFSIPNMAGDFGVGVRNLYGKLTGGQSDYEYPSDMYRRGMDQLVKPENKAESVEAMLAPMLVGSGAARAPGAVSTILGGEVPQTANATAPLFDAAGNAVKLAPNTATPEQVRAMTLANILKNSQELGLVVPRATTNPTATNRLVETLGSKVGTAQEASVRNQAAANKVAARYVGLNEDTQITPQALSEIRKESGKAYDDMRKIGPVTPDDQLRSDMLALRDRIGGVEQDFPGSPASPLSKEIDSILGTARGTSNPRSPQRLVQGLQETKPAPPAPVATAPGPRNGVILDPLTLTPQSKTNGLGSLGNPAPPLPPPVAPTAPRGPASTVRTDALMRPVQPPAFDPIGAAGNGASGPSVSSGGGTNTTRMDPLTLNPRSRTFDASNMITKIKNLRDAADVAGRGGDKGLAAGYKQMADSLEAQIDRAVQSKIAGGDTSINPDAVQRFRDGRKMIAKTYSVENALNPATGDVSLQTLGRMRKNGEPMEGELGKLGDFGASFEQASRPPAKIGSAGVNHLEGGLTGVAALAGGMLGGHSEHSLLGTAVGVGTGLALPLVRRGAVNYALGSGQAGAIPKAASALNDLGPTQRKAALLAALQQMPKRREAQSAGAGGE